MQDASAVAVLWLMSSFLTMTTTEAGMSPASKASSGCTMSVSPVVVVTKLHLPSLTSPDHRTLDDLFSHRPLTAQPVQLAGFAFCTQNKKNSALCSNI